MLQVEKELLVPFIKPYLLLPAACLSFWLVLAGSHSTSTGSLVLLLSLTLTVPPSQSPRMCKYSLPSLQTTSCLRLQLTGSSVPLSALLEIRRMREKTGDVMQGMKHGQLC